MLSRLSQTISNTIKDPLIASYALIWVAYLSACFVVPTNSLYNETHMQATLLVAIYVALSIFVAFLLRLIAPGTPCTQSPERLNSLFHYIQPRRLIVLASSLMFLGLLLHLYDKIFIMDIDYSAGIAKARHEWAANGAKRGGGISSWQSVSGHILSNFYFIVMLPVLLFWEELPKPHKFLGYFLSIAVVLVYSATMGSRTVPLLFLLYVINLILLRKPLKKRYLSKSLKFLFPLLILLIFVYNIFVFQKRSEVFGDNSPKNYAESFFNHLGGEKTGHFEFGEKLPGCVKSLFYHSVLTVVYVTHNQWTFDYVLTLDDRPGQSTLNTVYCGLIKIGILDSSQLEQRAFTGKFLSLPGCAYYDYGVLGLFMISISHGTLLFIASYLIRKESLKLCYLFLFILVGLFSLVSPLSSAANLMSFPYIIISALRNNLWVRK